MESNKMKIYEDWRGWLFKVMPGLGNRFKARYKNPSRGGWHCVAILPWRNTEAEAQADLDEYAEKKGMQIFQVLSEDGKKQHRRERKKCMTV